MFLKKYLSTDLTVGSVRLQMNRCAHFVPRLTKGESFIERQLSAWHLIPTSDGLQGPIIIK